MNKIQKIIMVFSLMAAAGMVSGCASVSQSKIETTSMDYNMLVENVQNKMLLLNIVRASKRRPLYFTTFTSLSGGMEYNYSTGSIHLPFAVFKGGKDVFSVGPSISYSTKPSFAVSVLDSKEFTESFMMPVPLQLVYFYLKEGLHKEELWHLLIKRIEKNSERFYNNPANREEFEKFQPELREFLKCDLVQKNEKNEIHYSYKCDGSEFPISKIDTAGGYSVKGGLTFYVRSPEAVIYYLGQIMRAEAQAHFTPKIILPDCNEPVVLFVARKVGEGDKKPVVAVEYEDETYIIPSDKSESDVKCPENNSMHVLSILSQLINMQKSVKDTPMPQLLNVINQ